MKKAFFICQNYYHLYVSAFYNKNSKYEHLEKNLVWIGEKNEIIENIKPFWDNVEYFQIKSKKNFNDKIRNYISIFTIDKRFKSLYKKDDEVTLFVFTDNNVYIRKILNTISKKNKKSKKILIDEGFGLYQPTKNPINGLKKLAFKILRIPTPYGIAIGENNSIDYILARHPEKLSQRKSNKVKVISQSDNLFNQENLDCFFKNIGFSKLKYENEERYRYIYIGQPLEERGIEESDETIVLKNIFDKIDKKDSILIKPHPRENPEKYNFLDQKNNITIISDELSLCPAEILLEMFSGARIITPFSSSGINAAWINKNLYPIFIYKLLDVKIDMIEKTILSLTNGNCIIAKDMDSFIENLADKRTINNEVKNHSEDLKLIKNILNSDI